MVPLGLCPVLAATVKLILIQTIAGDSLGTVLISGSTDSRDVAADNQLVVHSDGRERRNVQCRQGYYLHPNETHCCIRCHKGTYVAQHCVSEDKTPICAGCPEGSYMSHDNSAEKCRGCQSCRSTFKQVQLSSCSDIQDTVCTCAKDHYRTDDSPEFICNPCSTCHNGTILKTCTTSSNTICTCHRGFFHRADKNNCFPCSSCRGEECKQCDVVNANTSPPNSSDMSPILGTLAVIFAAGILLLAGKWVFKRPLRKKLVSAFNICDTFNTLATSSPVDLGTTPQRQQPSPELQITEPELQGTRIPQEPNQKEMLLPPPTAISAPSNTQGLPDCIPSAGETQIPDCPSVLYAVVDHVPFTQWKEFMRRLGLTDNAISRIEAEERHMRDAQYKMLKFWRLQLGHLATVERISSVLKEMELRGCSEAIQDILSGQP